MTTPPPPDAPHDPEADTATVAEPPAPVRNRWATARRRVFGSRVGVVVVAAVLAVVLVGGGIAVGAGLGDGHGRDDREGRGPHGMFERGGHDRGERDGMSPQFGGRNDSGGNVTQTVLGTVTAVDASSITLKTSVGSSTYPIPSGTSVVRGGVQSSLLAIQKGDAVQLSIAGGSSGPVVERVVAA